jgi:hypothetical protein
MVAIFSFFFSFFHSFRYAVFHSEALPTNGNDLNMVQQATQASVMNTRVGPVKG